MRSLSDRKLFCRDMLLELNYLCKTNLTETGKLKSSCYRANQKDCFHKTSTLFPRSLYWTVSKVAISNIK